MAETIERAYEVFIDPVSGLYDRRTMWSRLAEEVSRARRYHYPLTLMLVALSTPEAQRATEHLLQLAELLKQYTRASDVLTRYSEDTLLLLLPCTDERGALLLAERIRRLALGVQEQSEEPSQEVAVSIGVTSAHGDYIGDKVALVEQVEWALYKAREQQEGDRTVVVPAPQRIRSSEEAGK